MSGDTTPPDAAALADAERAERLARDASAAHLDRDRLVGAALDAELAMLAPVLAKHVRGLLAERDRLAAELAALREAARRLLVARQAWATGTDYDGTGRELDTAFVALAELLRDKPA